jgi:Family of unknown function (DUF6220)
MQMARYLFAALAALFVMAIVVQVFLAGLFLFAGVDRSWHEEFGYWVGLPVLLALLVAWPAHVSRRLAVLAVASFVDYVVQTSLPYFQGGSASIVAALHPVNALLMLWLGVTIATEAVALARRGPRASSAAVAALASSGGTVTARPVGPASGGHQSMEQDS